MMPRDVLPMKPGVSILLRPGTDRRPSRGAREPAALRSVNSSISAGNWSSFCAGLSTDIAALNYESAGFRSLSQVLQQACRGCGAQ